MQRYHLHYKQPELDKLNKRYTWAAIAAAGVGAGIGAGIGGGVSMYEGAQNRKAAKEAANQQFNWQASPDYIALRDKLYGITNTGIPGAEQWGQDYYTNQLMPQIREQYETKRNPYGGSWADTPEFALASQGARGVASDIGQLNLQAKMDAYKTLAGLTSGYQPTVGPQALAPTLGPAIAAGGIGLAGSIYGANQQTKAFENFLKLYGSDKTLKDEIQPTDYGAEDFWKDPYSQLFLTSQGGK